MVFFLVKGDRSHISRLRELKWGHLVKVLSVLLTGFSAVALFFTVQLGKLIRIEKKLKCALQASYFASLTSTSVSKHNDRFRKAI